MTPSAPSNSIPKPPPPPSVRPQPAHHGSCAQPPAIASDSAQASAFVVPGGTHRGKTLEQLAQTDEGCSYLYYLAHKRTAAGNADKALAAAAVLVLEAQVAKAVEHALAQPDEAMPLLPFSDEKGKRLDQAHPKWVAFLARKQSSDARSYVDLVLYGVAQRLAATRGPSSGYTRAGGLNAEQFGQLLAALQDIAAALEQIAART